MKQYFLAVISVIKSNLESQENFTAWFSSECLNFTRFNHAKIRQAGTVFQTYIHLDLISGQRHVNQTLGLSRDLAKDQEELKATIKKLRGKLAFCQDDPYFMINHNNVSTESESFSSGPDQFDIVQDILSESAGLDLVGCYFGGPLYRGFANGIGQINWFAKSSFVIDMSIYHSQDKAIKLSYSDQNFDGDVFRSKLGTARLELELLKKQATAISPGSYRVYFAPAAVHEILLLLNWDGFSRKAMEIKNSPLMSLFTKQKQLSELFSLSENIQDGIGPNFQPQGFIKKPRLPIIENGKFVDCLISPKTAKEYSLVENGADDSEALSAMDMAAGTLSTESILRELGDGLFINNLWYLNFSDRQNGCLTGMTRFLCYVVKNKEASTPLSVMRFDDSIYRIFGDNLRLITSMRQRIADTSTYDERATSSAILPGIIVDNVRFTL